MEEIQNQEAPKMSSVEQEEFELSHTDKLVGVFSEPTATFEKMSKFPPKTSDWLIPILIVIVIAILSQVLMMNNPTIYASMIEKQRAAIEKSLKNEVDKGTITQEEANTRMEQSDPERMSKTTKLIFTGIGIPVIVFIMFFIISGVFLLLAKFGLNGQGVYKDGLVAYGLPHYISAIQMIIMVIAALATSKIFTGTSIADFLDSDKTTIVGFLLGKLDVFSIWFYVVFGIGLAKMFKSNNTQKYIIAVLAVWLGFSLLFFFLAKEVPFLSSFTG